MEIVDEKNVTWAEARKLMEKKKTLGYEQKNALEHLKRFSKFSEKKTQDFMKMLGRIERLKDRQKISIINMLPRDMDDIRVLFANEIITISEDEKKDILNIVKKFT